MKDTPAALKNHNALPVTTLAYLWKVTRTDSVVFGFTNHDRGLALDGVTYQARAGFSATAIRTEARYSVANLDVIGVLDSETITESDIHAGLWDYARIEVMEVNWADLSMGVRKHRVGWLGEVRRGKLSFEAELRGLAEKLQQNIGAMIGPDCEADLGDARCKVELGPFTGTGAITSATSNRLFADSGRSEADGWFDEGKITWTTGANAGLSMEVKAYLEAGGSIELQQPMPFAVEVGDEYEIVAGCRKRFTEDCKSKFDNAVNFQGFPHLPGLRRQISGGL